jgi:hypothetical protein
LFGMLHIDIVDGYKKLPNITRKTANNQEI